MKLLVSTPAFLIGFDTSTSQAEVLASGDGEYYGISWDPSGLRLALSHSGIDLSKIADLPAYAQSERGHVSVAGEASWPFLSAPHQILWIDDEWIVATNTGRNALVKMRVTDKSVIQYRYSDVLWDRLTPAGTEGAHYNSLFYRDGILYVVAHNFDKGSFILRLHWPGMDEIDRVSVPASGIHNLWIDREGRWITCDSEAGTLIDAKTGTVLWRDGGQGHLRGLASADGILAIGGSPFSNRVDRTRSETGIWLVEAETWRTLDYFHLGHFGCVNELRITDVPDSCHHGVPLADIALHYLVGTRESIAAARLSRAERSNSQTGKWLLQVGSSTIPEQPVMRPSREEFFLAALREKNSGGEELTARLHVGPYWRSGDYAGLVARYRGPGDKNMIAVLFQRTVKGDVAASFWLEQGEWRMLAEALLPDNVWSSDRNADKISGEEQMLPIGLRVEDGGLELRVDGVSILSLRDIAPGERGRWGIRMFGASFGMSEVVLRSQ